MPCLVIVFSSDLIQNTPCIVSQLMLEISLNSSLYIFCSKPDRRRVFYTNISAVTVVEASQRLYGHGSSVVETPPWEACVDEVRNKQQKKFYIKIKLLKLLYCTCVLQILKSDICRDLIGTTSLLIFICFDKSGRDSTLGSLC